MEKEKSKEKKCAIFFVDDDIDDREFFCEALEDVGGDIQMKLLAGGEALFKELRSGKPLPDIVFLDFLCP